MRWFLIWLLIDAGSLKTDYPDQQEVVAAASEYSWPVVQSLGIAWCESFHKLTAWNGHDAGPWQINEFWWKEYFGKKTWSLRFTAEGSAYMAHHIWSMKENFVLWTCGRYN